MIIAAILIMGHDNYRTLYIPHYSCLFYGRTYHKFPCHRFLNQPPCFNRGDLLHYKVLRRERRIWDGCSSSNHRHGHIFHGIRVHRNIRVDNRRYSVAACSPTVVRYKLDAIAFNRSGNLDICSDCKLVPAYSERPTLST